MPEIDYVKLLWFCFTHKEHICLSVLTQAGMCQWFPGQQHILQLHVGRVCGRYQPAETRHPGHWSIIASAVSQVWYILWFYPYLTHTFHIFESVGSKTLSERCMLLKLIEYQKFIVNMNWRDVQIKYVVNNVDKVKTWKNNVVLKIVLDNYQLCFKFKKNE